MRPFLKLVNEYIESDPRDLKDVWKVEGYQSIILTTVNFLKVALTETTSVKRRRALVELAAFLVVAYDFLGEDEVKDQEAVQSMIPKKEQKKEKPTDKDTLKALLG